MKGDFSRLTFARKNHYSSVRMQQGRVQLDADWNEQADIVAHRERVTTRDLVGGCGGPLGGAAFEVRLLARPRERPPVDIPSRPLVEDVPTPAAAPGAGTGRPLIDTSEVRPVDPSGIRVNNPSGIAPIRLPRRVNIGDDFALSAGRYYVDGILCENEQEVRYSQQPDFPDATTFGNAPFDEATLYLLYLDVWQRHLTVLDDPHIREIALGGPDTTTRTKTVWQAKLWKVPRANGVTCPEVFKTFMQTEAGRNKGLLNASSTPEDSGSNPCIVPPSAGYRGLENLLYRVEVHAGGTAADVSTGAGGLVVGSLGESPRNQLTLNAGPAPHVGDAIELYPSRAGSSPLSGRLYFVTAVDNLTLTLNQDVQGLEMSQQPRLRVASATFKWSRQNGSVVTKIETISSRDSKEITVQSLGPDDDLGFSDGDWVELTDDLTELRGEPGQLTQIVTADNGTRAVVLKDAPTVLTSQNAKMRRWDGLGAVRMNSSDPNNNWITLENGLRIQFTPTGADGTTGGVYANGDYWLIPTRTATADRESGQIEWPLDKPIEQGGKPQPQPPAGIEHRYCPLALLDWNSAKGITVVSDCRRLFPAVTELTMLHYVSGTGQEAMPVLPSTAQSLVELLHPLVVGVSNGGVPVGGARVVFEVVEGELNEATPGVESDFPNGRLSALPGGRAVVISDTKIEVRTDADGLASCKWELSPARWNQQVVARLLGPDQKTPIHLPVRFNANLSVASEVAYESGACDKLAGVTTVQEALDKLCSLLGLSNESGVHVTDVSFGTLRNDKIENDFDLTCEALAGGLSVTCDRELFPGSVKGKPTCFVTLELPFPSGASEKTAWGLSSTDPTFFGYQPVILAGDPNAEGQTISWRPSQFANKWLRDTLPGLLTKFNTTVAGTQRPGRVLARLTLKGNFIWSRTDASLYLDGEVFGFAEPGGAVTAVRAPSGDGKRGGDLELWFWLVQFSVNLQRAELNVGETTSGTVELSGPAPPQGATVQLSVSDPTVAVLTRNTAKLNAGETQGAFEVRGLKQGQVVIRANYAGGQREVTLRVTQPAPLLKVKRVTIIRRNSPTTGGSAETVLFEARDGAFNNNIQLPGGAQVNTIEIEFTGGPVNQDSVRQGASFVVRRLGPTVQLQAGQLQWVSGSVVRWNATTPLSRGNFSVALLSGTDPITNQAASSKILAIDGRTLDGEPSRLPSGNNAADGTFFFTLLMS